MNKSHRAVSAGIGLLILTAASAFGGYVVEWSATVSSYAYSTVYTANKTFSYDITGDSIPEVFVTDSAAIKVYNGVTHGLIWSIPTTGYSTAYMVSICNTDGDANRELVLSAYTYSYPNYSGRFFVYDCQTHSQEYASPVKSGYPSVACADVDGDNKSEICMLSGTSSRLLEVYGSDAASVGEHSTPELLPVECEAIPNPCGRTVVLSFDRPVQQTLVTLTDISGRVVRRLPVRADAMSVVWDSRNDQGEPVPPGSYIYNCGSVTGKIVCR
jgi:hypothetical protein